MKNFAAKMRQKSQKIFGVPEARGLPCIGRLLVVLCSRARVPQQGLNGTRIWVARVEFVPRWSSGPR